MDSVTFIDAERHIRIQSSKITFQSSKIRIPIVHLPIAYTPSLRPSRIIPNPTPTEYTNAKIKDQTRNININQSHDQPIPTRPTYYIDQRVPIQYTSALLTVRSMFRDTRSGINLPPNTLAQHCEMTYNIFIPLPISAKTKDQTIRIKHHLFILTNNHPILIPMSEG